MTENIATQVPADAVPASESASTVVLETAAAVVPETAAPVVPETGAAVVAEASAAVVSETEAAAVDELEALLAAVPAPSAAMQQAWQIPADAAVERALPPLPGNWTSLLAAIFASTKANPTALCAGDTAETRLKAGSTEETEIAYLTRQEFLQRAAAVARVLSSKLDASTYVGIMLPPSLACALVNVAVLMLKKVPVNLNYLSTTAIVDHCIGVCDIKHVVSEPLLLKRTKVTPTNATIIAASELKAAIDPAVLTWVQTALTAAPADLPTYFPGLLSTLEDTSTILFTSGSTGMPKGVELTNFSMLSDIRAMQVQFSMGNEKMLGVGPAFHTMGFTGCIMAPLVLGNDVDAEGNERSIVVLFHANALEAKKICGLVQSEAITFFIGIPSMVSMYISRATAGQFASVRHLVLGAEKVEDPLRNQVKAITGLDVEEVYGATEFGPLASTNVNISVEINGKKIWGNRPGSVGLMAPGSAVKILDMTTNAPLPRGEQNMGWIYLAGPQIMRRYLNEPEKTAEVLREGWYMSGDYGYVDEDGFLYILGRLIIKSAGEIIPPFTVRGKILEITGVSDTKVFVIGAKDSRRGERPAVLYTDLGGKTPAEVTAALQDKLPALWIPKASDYALIEGESLPVGTTGKLDLLVLKKLAAEKFPAE